MQLLALPLWLLVSGCHWLLPFSSTAASPDGARETGAVDAMSTDGPRDGWPEAPRDLRKRPTDASPPERALPDAKQLEGGAPTSDAVLELGPVSCVPWSAWTCQVTSLVCYAQCGGMHINCYSTGECYCYKNIVPYKCTGIGSQTGCTRCEAAVTKGCCP